MMNKFREELAKFPEVDLTRLDQQIERFSEA
jgi:hypothetical protein